MDLVVEPASNPREGILSIGADGQYGRYRCALGRGGVRSNKHEGDGATPIGQFPLRQLFYRGDRGAQPVSNLPIQMLTRSDGWCDDAAHPDYNRFVTLPFTGRCERMWRDDALYDIVAVIGYNDAPVHPGLGSAIFLHVAAPDYAPTEGCVALAQDDLRRVLEHCDEATTITILKSFP